MKQKLSDDLSGWLEVNTKRLEEGGLAVEFTETKGDVWAFIDLAARDILVRIYVFDTGMVDFDGGTKEQGFDFKLEIDDSKGTIENIDNIANFVLRYLHER